MSSKQSEPYTAHFERYLIHIAKFQSKEREWTASSSFILLWCFKATLGIAQGLLLVLSQCSHWSFSGKSMVQWINQGLPYVKNVLSPVTHIEPKCLFEKYNIPSWCLCLGKLINMNDNMVNGIRAFLMS